MSVAATPTYCSMHRASVIVLGVGFALSVVIHLGVGAGASGYLGSFWGVDDSSESAIEVEPDSAQLIAAPDEVRLGMQDSTVASINWLGVIDNPEVGDAPVAEVEQVEFTQQVGDAPVTVSPQPAVQPTPEPTAVLEEITAKPIVQEEQPEVVEAEARDVDLTEQIVLEVEEKDSAPIVIDVQPEPIDEPDEDVADEVVEDSVESETPVGPELSSVDPAPIAEPIAEPEPVQIQERSKADEPAKSGKDGIESEKESAASIIKRAMEVNASKLNRPIAGNGLEITTRVPIFPASVRFTELPRNPVVMIRFDASGRVSKAYFLTEGKRVFDTGVRGVDEPLLSAVYKWRAKGKEIDALEVGLDPDDPDSYIEIPMRITFRKESKTP